MKRGTFRFVLALDSGLSTLDFSVAQVGVEPTASLVLSQGGLPVAYRAVVDPLSVVPDGVDTPPTPGHVLRIPLLIAKDAA